MKLSEHKSEIEAKAKEIEALKKRIYDSNFEKKDFVSKISYKSTTNKLIKEIDSLKAKIKALEASKASNFFDRQKEEHERYQEKLKNKKINNIKQYKPLFLNN